MGIDWQVDSGRRRSVFVSATTSDLGECRKRVSEILLGAGIFPVVQDHFGPDHRTIAEMLMDKIRGADAVLCLVGHRYGVAATGAGEDGALSYTQLERDLAIRYGKPVYLFIASDSFAPPDQGEPEAFRCRQQSYRQTILAGATKYNVFSSMGELEKLVWAVLQPIAAQAGHRSIKYVHLPPSPAQFVGRQEETDQLRAALERPSPSVIALLGMGGQGKTSLAFHTLNERKALPFSAGVWVTAGHGGFTFNEFLDCALAELTSDGFQPSEMPQMEHRVRKLLSLLQRTPVLLVIDSIEHWLEGWQMRESVVGLYETTLRKGACEGLDEFLVQASGLRNGSHILLTSRALPAAMDTLECSIIPVYPDGDRHPSLRGLSEESAVELLARLGVVASEEKMREIARSFVYHPLALTGFARVAAKLGKQWEPFLSGKGLDPGGAFTALLKEIRTRLPNRDLSEHILALVSILKERPSLGLLQFLLSKIEPDRSRHGNDVLAHVLALDEWNLLKWDADTDAVEIHGLVADFFGRMLTAEERISTFQHAAAWHEAQAGRNTESMATEHFLMALRNWIQAGCAQDAQRLLFTGAGAGRGLLDQLRSEGRLWTCVELLASVEGLTNGEERVRCILARASLLNEMELSQRALVDLQRVTGMILAQTGLVRLVMQPYLAECYGLLGVVHTETGRATQGVRFHTQALLLFREIASSSRSNRLAIGLTLANRGLARWLTGDWDGAELDYREALAELFEAMPAPEDEHKRAPLIFDIRGRMASLLLDRGQPSEAVTTLERLVEEMRAEPCRASDRQEKNRLTIHLTLARARIAAGEPGGSLVEIREVTQVAGVRLDTGRWDYAFILAQAHTIQSRALLQLGLPLEAETVADRAVQLYETMLEKGAEQFRGQLSTALFRRADARIVGGRISDGCTDLSRAIDTARAWIREWASECDIRHVFLSHALNSLGLIGSTAPDSKRRLLAAIGDTAEELRKVDGTNSALVRDFALIRQQWEHLARIAKEVGASWREAPP